MIGLPNTIKILRKRKKLTQEFVSLRGKIPRRTLQRIEAGGNYTVKHDIVERLAKGLDEPVGVLYFLSFSENFSAEKQQIETYSFFDTLQTFVK